MKTFKLLLLSVFFCFFVMSSYSQSFTDKYEWEFNDWRDFYVMVECDGVVDWIYGDVQVHRVLHANPKTGIFDWYKHSRKGIDLQSWNTGEKFKMNYTRKIDFNGMDVNVWSFHVNLKGDAGTHIIYSFVEEYDPATDTWTVLDEKIKCF